MCVFDFYLYVWDLEFLIYMWLDGLYDCCFVEVEFECDLLVVE